MGPEWPHLGSCFSTATPICHSALRSFETDAGPASPIEMGGGGQGPEQRQKQQQQQQRSRAGGQLRPGLVRWEVLQGSRKLGEESLGSAAEGK